MGLAQGDTAMIEAEALRSEVDDLRDMLARLSEASINICENLDAETALQEVVNSVAKLTGARYGTLVTLDPSGGICECYTSGVSEEQRELMTQAQQAPGLLGYLNKAKGPVRLKDVEFHPDSVHLPQSQPPLNSFLGIPIRRPGEHVGYLYLTAKEEGQEFTQEDENMAAMFAAQAASIIFSSRRYEEAHRGKAELEALMDISPVGVSVFDTRIGQVTFLNQEARRVLGRLGVTDVDAENLYESLRFTRTDGREIPFAELPGTRALQTGEIVRAEEIVIHLPNGNRFTTLINCAPLFSGSGEMVSLLSVLQDMTPVEDLEQQRNEFLGMVSEELWTPLTTIKGSAAILRGLLEPMNSMESSQLLRIIDQQTDLMRSQVNSLTELTQIETGSLSVVSEPTDVAGLLEGTCKEYLGDHASVDIKLQIPKGLPTVMADRHRISQVLHNLLRQAGKHTTESSPVQVAASVIDIYVAVSISVEGSYSAPVSAPSPFNETDVHQLFEKISRDQNNLTDLLTQGEGLAFAFCRGVVEAHGGRIRMEVDEQEGSLTLTFTLPSVENEERILIPDFDRVAGELPAAPAEGAQILVSIEDARMVSSVRRVLTSAGYGMVRASRLDEVEELASSEGTKLILLDIAGREEECFHALRRSRNLLNLPAIVLCDRDDEEYVVRAFDMGADGYMVKPFSSSELIARIKATLRRTNSGGEAASSKTFQSGDLLINFDERAVIVSGQPVQLTATEYKLLAELANGAGRVLTQDMVLERVWGPEYSGESQLLRSYVKSLRQKLGDNARDPSYIFTEHGIGYRMVKSSPKDNGPEAPTSEPLGISSSARRSRSALQRTSARLRSLPQRWDYNIK